MTKIKIVSNPYSRNISYYIYKEQTDIWENIKKENINSRLCEIDEEKTFLPFKIKEIIDTIISEYYVGIGCIELIFEGTADEYEEVENICLDEKYRDKIQLIPSARILENARDILEQTKESFNIVHPLIKNIVKNEEKIIKDLDRVSDALKDIIPVCVFGNYSAGKSTFINALIGHEVLPSGGDPITSKIYEIKCAMQPDRARIVFVYCDEEFELVFDNKECRVAIGDREKDIIRKIFTTISKLENINLFQMVNATIEVLNFFEKRDRTKNFIGNVVKIEVPFSGNGKFGQSHNEFVIFDTPGSNSQTNIDHEQVLMESLEGFSNGIPIWVSQYDSIDSVDNAHLCDKLYQIDALDKRFTMIVINKADSVELPKNGLTSEDVSNIMEYESIEKMYSSGIYFVSSVMGLGAKNPDGIISEYLADVFDEKERKFSDSTARSYKKLYEYNIMPEQMKQKAMEYSLACENLIYANSGIYCVEMEIEQFASRYAAYNKCQMVYMFLKNIIDETDRRIAEKIDLLEERKTSWEQQLDAKKFQLVESIQKNTEDFIKKYDNVSKNFMRDYTKEELDYEQTVEELDTIEQELTKKNLQDANFELYETEYEGAKSGRWKNLLENMKSFSKDNWQGSARNIAAEFANDSREKKQKKESRDLTRREADKATADKLMGIVVRRFKDNMIDAQDKLCSAARDHWIENAKEYRDEMVRMITESDALSDQQRIEISDIILNYKPLQFEDEVDKVFNKAKFLRGNVLGIRFVMSERLDTKRLAFSYNSRVRHNLNEMSKHIHEDCFAKFKEWQENLQLIIEENITIYNPELRKLNGFIRDETETIHELQNNQKKISNSFKAIEDMMDWKVLE